MRIGLNTLLLVSPFTTRSTRLFPKIKNWGFDTVEIAVEDPANIDPVKVRRELDRHELACGTLCGIFGANRDFRGNAQQQADTEAYLRVAIDYAEVLGAHSVIGPAYSAVGHAQAYSPAEKKAQFKTVVANLKRVAAYAEQKGKTICIEPLNRFETDFINTCEQALELVRKVDSPAVKVMLDTFHMNIEEKDPAAAIRKAGKLLGHLHACGSDRGTPGNDHIDWVPIARALKQIGYKGDVVVESFTPGIEVIAKAASIWRKFEPSEEAVSAGGAKFLRKLLGKKR
jgi:D-psicose/D-tagatose/L-ribulose 3-epimerase